MSLMQMGVSSSMFESPLYYDDVAETLFVKFSKSGQVYRYDGVTEDDYKRLEAAQADKEKSVSAEFNAIIRPAKSYSKLEGEELEGFQAMIAEPAPPIPMPERKAV